MDDASEPKKSTLTPHELREGLIKSFQSMAVMHEAIDYMAEHGFDAFAELLGVDQAKLMAHALAQHVCLELCDTKISVIVEELEGGATKKI